MIGTRWYLTASVILAPLSLIACQAGEPASTDTDPATSSAAQEIANPALLSPVLGAGCNWTQWRQSADHEGTTCATGQSPNRIVEHITYDPFEFQEITEGFGDLFVHYQVPLVDDVSNFYMLQKGGTYTSCDPPDSDTPFPCGLDQANIVQETWSEKKYRRKLDGSYEAQWQFDSDWKPFPAFLFEPMFQPALAGPFLYVPGAGGSVFQVLSIFNQPITIQRISPFGDTIDPNTYTSSGVTIDKFGFLYWNVLQNDPDTFENRGFLIKASPTGQTWKVDYENLIPGAPAEFDSCFYTFFFQFPQVPQPFPPSADALPPQFACGRQRPGVNITPAIGSDGTIFTASAADFNSNYSYMIALNPDLSLKWATSMRGLVNDGCGVHRPGFPEGDVLCSDTFSAIGVDPLTNLPPALTVDDDSSSTPVALPDGGVLYGALDDYNFSRGHLAKFDKTGKFVASYTFGWDSTPAVYPHDGTYSIIIKDNHYNTNGPYFITQLSADLVPEWSFQDKTTQACVRQPDGTLQCSDIDSNGVSHANGFEWCVNAPAVDARGNVFANSEDGNVYEIGQGGVQKTQTFLNQALGAAYTPISLDQQGRVFALNNGELTVLGR